jgi:uncharacterized DUF497 family protein
MDPIRFEWDPEKARENEKKHGVSFEEARTSFSDEQGLLLADPDHSEKAKSVIILLGLSSKLRLLVVVHSVPSDDVIRIISARKATRMETRDYETQLRW